MSEHVKPGRRVGSYAALLFMLMAWLVIFPIFSTGGAKSSIVSEFLFAALLLSSVGAAAGHPREMKALGLLAIALVAVSVVRHANWGPQLSVRVILESLRILFLVLIVRVVLKHIIRTPSVTADMILGAVCVYLMVAGVFAEAYRIVDMLDPHAIQFIDATLDADLPQGYTEDRYVYFSMVTLTTLGFGDVVPISSVARALVQIEAIIGQLYVAVVLAFLVGKYVSDAEDQAAASQ